jgi:hypothetical protein
MSHPLVDHLRFARSELVRSLDGVTENEATRRFLPMNSISWIVGHLADQEQRYWLERQGHPHVVKGLNAQVGYGQPASTPPLAEMWEAWRTITAATDPVLDAFTEADLLSTPLHANAKGETNGTLIQRVTWHYWFHLGEGQAIRQLLGHTGLPEFVGDMDTVPYRKS